jgi:hypothetical protein
MPPTCSGFGRTVVALAIDGSLAGLLTVLGHEIREHGSR